MNQTFLIPLLLGIVSLGVGFRIRGRKLGVALVTFSYLLLAISVYLFFDSFPPF